MSDQRNSTLKVHILQPDHHTYHLREAISLRPIRLSPLMHEERLMCIRRPIERQLGLPESTVEVDGGVREPALDGGVKGRAT